MRKGDYIRTFTGVQFYPFEPRHDEIKLVDIAHSLSLMCRANGHYSHFYSVGHHSLLCYEEAKSLGYSKRVQLACLLHDGSEAYISDITRPVKKHLFEYKQIEDSVQNMIWEVFGLADLTEEEHRLIKEVDDALLKYELAQLLNYQQDAPTVKPVSKPYDLSFRLMEDVKEEFILKVNALVNELSCEEVYS